MAEVTHVSVFTVEGMTCQNCVQKIEAAFNKLPSVVLVKVSLQQKDVIIVQKEPASLSAASIMQTISTLGFAVAPSTGDFCVTSLNITGMTCISCVHLIEDALSQVTGVRFNLVSLDKNSALVVFKPAKVSIKTLCEAVVKAGFFASPFGSTYKETKIGIEGMTCNSCVRSIESTISGLPGVGKIVVSLEKKMATVNYNSAVTSPAAIAGEIDSMGFEASVSDDVTSPSDSNNQNADACQAGCSTKNGGGNEEVVGSGGNENCVASRDDLEDFLISVLGMTCESCVRSVEACVTALPGIKSVKVSLADSCARVTAFAKKTSAQFVAAAVSDIGFEASVMSGIRKTLMINIQGMHDSSSAKAVEAKLNAVSGVESVEVFVVTKSVQVLYNSDVVGAQQLISAIESDGRLKASIGTDISQSNAASNLKPLPDIEISMIPSSSKSDVSSAKTAASSSGFGRKVTFNRKKYGVSLVDAEDDDGLEKCFLHVMGMTCSSCVANIEKRLLRVEGVKTVLVSLMAEKAEIRYDPAYIMPSQIANKVTALGYSSSVLEGESDGRSTVEVQIEGMTCASCVHLIESTMLKKPGILSSAVALATCRGKFTYDTSITGIRDILEAIDSIGFKASLMDSNQRGLAYLDHQKAIKKSNHEAPPVPS